MKLYHIRNYFIAIQRQGNDKNGNPIFIINIFDQQLNNINYQVTKYRLDKYNNIKLTSYSIETDIEYIVKQFDN